MASRKVVTLRIPMEGLEVYLVDGEVGWNRHDSRKFREEGGWYTLALEGTTGAEFKCFVHVRAGQNPQDVRKALEKAGLEITGHGDVDPKSGQTRLWFTIPGMEISGSGVWTNNVWGKEETVIFPPDKGSKVREEEAAPEDRPPR